MSPYRTVPPSPTMSFDSARIIRRIEQKFEATMTCARALIKSDTPFETVNKFLCRILSIVESIPAECQSLKQQVNQQFDELLDLHMKVTLNRVGTSLVDSTLDPNATINISLCSNLDTSDLIKAEKSFTHDITMMFEQEMEDEEEEIRKLMYLEPVDVALIDEKMANLTEALDKDLTILDSTKWLDKIGQLVMEYLERCVLPENAEGSTNIGSKIKQAFNKLAPIDEKLFGSDEYLVAIRNLLELVVKSRKIVTVLDTGNKVLQREALDWAVSKLSSPILAEFYDRRFEQPNLSSLILFLCRHLAELIQPPPGTFPANVCHYCKLPGHFVAQCPKVELITCFRCFKHGHHKNLCENEEATAEELLANL